MHPADDRPDIEALLDALTSEDGANGRMRQAIRYNEHVAANVRSWMLVDEHGVYLERHRSRVAAHEHEARGLVELSWPIVVAMWGRLDWPERARIAGVLALPTPRDLRRGAAYVASWVVLAWRSLAILLPW